MKGQFRVIEKQIPDRRVYYPACEESDLFLSFVRSIDKSRKSFTVDNLVVIKKMRYDIVIDKSVPIFRTNSKFARKRRI